LFVCLCTAVTEREIRDCVLAGARTVDEVGDLSMAGTGCGGCRERIEMILAGEGALGTLELCALQRTA
jgi:bacterioferritin-associated ferredoxin